MRKKIDINIFKEEFSNPQIPLKDIAKKYGYSEDTIRRFAKELDLGRKKGSGRKKINPFI